MVKSTFKIIGLLAILPMVVALPPLLAEPATQPVLCPAATDLQTKVMEVASKCVASTVGLVSKETMGIASGSGVVISSDGLIMTAGHVIEKPGNPLTIRFVDGKVVQGVAVGLDHMTDTGFARITDPAPAGGWAFCTVAPDDSARLGEWVIATGNPGSIVLDRNPPLRIGRVTAHDAKKIETNCALEPGDSGGPVFNLQGQVVGINSRIMASDTDIHLKEYLSVHVPVSLFTSQWKDLLAGANEHPDFVLGRKSGQGRGRGRGGNPEAARFRQAMDKLLAAKDPEVLKLLADSQKNGGRLPLTPELMQHLIKKAGIGPLTTQPTTAKSELAQAASTQPAEPTTAPAVQKGIAAALRPRLGAEIRRSLLQQFPDAKITDAILNRIMDRSSVDPFTHRTNLVTSPDDLKDMGVSPEPIAAKTANFMPTNRAAAEVGKMSLPTLSLFVPALEAAGDCVVEIRSADKPVLLGTIVDSDGWIVTKASDLPEHPAVVLADGRHLIARLIGKDSATDLALLKVSATGLTAARFSDATPLGSFLIAPTADSNQPAIGVVSDAPRPITEKLAHFAGEQKLVLGIGFAGPNLILGMISPGMPAEAAGLKAGDEILELNGEKVKDTEDFLAKMKKTKSGDTLTIKVRRDDQELEFKPVIGQAKATTQTMNSIGEADNLAGGKLSKRRTNFPLAIQTDAAIWADECGGPLINLQGQTVGVTIARYDRVCTFALPANLVEKTVAKLKQLQN